MEQVGVCVCVCARKGVRRGVRLRGWPSAVPAARERWQGHGVRGGRGRCDNAFVCVLFCAARLRVLRQTRGALPPVGAERLLRRAQAGRAAPPCAPLNPSAGLCGGPEVASRWGWLAQVASGGAPQWDRYPQVCLCRVQRRGCAGDSFEQTVNERNLKQSTTGGWFMGV